jgi:hypothetical protein
VRLSHIVVSMPMLSIGLRDHSSGTFLHFVAEQIGLSLWKKTHMWSKLILEAVEAGAELNAVDNNGYTPLLWVLCYSIISSAVSISIIPMFVGEIRGEGSVRKLVKQDVIEFLRILQNAKVDLVSYGEKEAAALKALPSQEQVLIVSLHFGQSPEDFNTNLIVCLHCSRNIISMCLKMSRSAGSKIFGGLQALRKTRMMLGSTL